MVKWKDCILWGGMSCSPDQLHLFLSAGPRTCCWLWTLGRVKKSQRGENNQNPTWTKHKKALQAGSEGAVNSHHPQFSWEQVAFHLQQVASSPRACTLEMTREPKKRKVSGFKFSFYWRKEKKKEKNRLFCFFSFFFFCLFVSKWTLFVLSVCLNVLRQRLLFTNVSRYSGRSLSLLLSLCLPGRGSLG